MFTKFGRLRWYNPYVAVFWHHELLIKNWYETSPPKWKGLDAQAVSLSHKFKHPIRREWVEWMIVFGRASSLYFKLLFSYLFINIDTAFRPSILWTSSGGHYVGYLKYWLLFYFIPVMSVLVKPEYIVSLTNPEIELMIAR